MTTSEKFGSFDDQPRHVKRAKRHKKYGIEEWSDHFSKWAHARWFATEKARDQSLEDLKHKTTILKLYGTGTQLRKVER